MSDEDIPRWRYGHPGELEFALRILPWVIVLNVVLLIILRILEWLL